MNSDYNEIKITFWNMCERCRDNKRCILYYLCNLFFLLHNISIVVSMIAYEKNIRCDWSILTTTTTYNYANCIVE